MLATGIKSPVGVKVAGTKLEEVDRIAPESERVVKQVPGVTSAFAERLTGGQGKARAHRQRLARRICESHVTDLPWLASTPVNRTERRTYTQKYKRAVVRECDEPGVSVAGVALAHRTMPIRCAAGSCVNGGS